MSFTISPFFLDIKLTVKKDPFRLIDKSMWKMYFSLTKNGLVESNAYRLYNFMLRYSRLGVDDVN